MIENVTMSDAGYYICTARNRIGMDVKAVHVIVNGNFLINTESDAFKHTTHVHRQKLSSFKYG